MSAQGSQTADPTRAQYEALGIFPDTWTCVAAMPKKDAKEYVFELALLGVPTKVALDENDTTFHVAVLGGLIDNPAAWVASIRTSVDVPTCPGSARTQHPQQRIRP